MHGRAGCPTWVGGSANGRVAMGTTVRSVGGEARVGGHVRERYPRGPSGRRAESIDGEIEATHRRQRQQRVRIGRAFERDDADPERACSAVRSNRGDETAQTRATLGNEPGLPMPFDAGNGTHGAPAFGAASRVARSEVQEVFTEGGVYTNRRHTSTDALPEGRLSGRGRRGPVEHGRRPALRGTSSHVPDERVRLGGQVQFVKV